MRLAFSAAGSRSGGNAVVPGGASRRLILLLCSLSLVLAMGCGGADMVAYTPVDQKTQSSPKALFDAAVASLQDMGYNLDEQDPATFHVKTAQRTHNVSELSHEKYRYVWTVDTADGRLEIRLTCEKNSGTHASEYKSCGAEAPAHLVDEQQKIRDAIVKQAGGG